MCATLCVRSARFSGLLSSGCLPRMLARGADVECSTLALGALRLLLMGELVCHSCALLDIW